jgi:uncharacterized protein YbjT (DUF2867 family)
MRPTRRTAFISAKETLMNRFLIVGGSGTVGSEIVKWLQKDGHPVRITTRQRTSSGNARAAERAHLDQKTGEGVKEAFEGVDRAFFLSPGGYADQYRMLSPLIQEAKRRKVRKVVLMTAFGANAVETSPLRRAEIELEKSGVPYNIIRPNWFMQNFNTFWVQGIRQEGKISLPAGSAKVSFIDTRDISAVAAKLLTSDGLNNQALDLTGPEAVDHSQVAQAISAATGKKVTYEDIDPGVLRERLLTAGLPEDYADFLLTIFGFLKLGYSAPVTDLVQKVAGRRPIDIRTYAQDHKKDWL